MKLLIQGRLTSDSHFFNRTSCIFLHSNILSSKKVSKNQHNYCIKSKIRIYKLPSAICFRTETNFIKYNMKTNLSQMGWMSEKNFIVRNTLTQEIAYERKQSFCCPQRNIFILAVYCYPYKQGGCEINRKILDNLRSVYLYFT